MPKLVSGRSTWAAELAEAVGETANTVSAITLSVRADSAVTVTIEKYVTQEQLGKVISLIKKHAWIEGEPKEEEVA